MNVLLIGLHKVIKNQSKYSLIGFLTIAAEKAVSKTRKLKADMLWEAFSHSPAASGEK